MGKQSEGTRAGSVPRGIREVPFVTHPIYRETGYRDNHPLSIERVGTVEMLCRHLGWFDCRKQSQLFESPPADIERLCCFHDREYVEAIISAERAGMVSRHVREKHNIGTMENPVFDGLFKRASTSVGGSILAAELAAKFGLAYHPAGGTHHGQKSRASGFCYFNDPVFAILRFLDLGFSNCIYVDLDAHHGDGVEMAFVGDERVFCVSIHEENRWPYSGRLNDPAAINVCNLPVPPEINDSEFHFLINGAVLELLNMRKPDCIVVTCGADALAGDPLSKMALSNGALWDAARVIAAINVPTVFLGGGGYNPWTTARCWAGLWGVLSNFELPDRLPHESTALLTGLECDLVDEEDIPGQWLTELVDPPNEGMIRNEFLQISEQVMFNA